MRPLRPLPLLLLLLGAVCAAQKPEGATKLDARAQGGGAGLKVYEVPITGVIDLGLAPFVERVVKEAGEQAVIILHMDTFGGRVDAAVRIRDALLRAKAKTVVFIDARAISAGALISLAADDIIMRPGASIGAATPVQQGQGGEMQPTSEKVVSYMRAEMRATAEAKGRPPKIAAAMVDPDIEVEGVSEKGKLLTLTSEEALEVGIADATALDYDAVIELLNLGEAERAYVGTNWGETLARWLTHPVVSSLLMTFGFLGVLMELYSPGFGIGGIIGLSCLALFFFGQHAANLAGWEEVLLFGLGVGLLLLELLVIPGFGIAGIAGIALMGTGLVMAMIELDLPLDVSLELGYFQAALWSALVRVAIAFLVMVVATMVLWKHLPSSGVGRRIILTTATDAKRGYVSTTETFDELLGREGRTVTVLRPQGTADFAGRRVDVASDGGFVEKGAPVRVVAVHGTRVVVEPLATPDEEELS